MQSNADVRDTFTPFTKPTPDMIQVRDGDVSASKNGDPACPRMTCLYRRPLSGVGANENVHSVKTQLHIVRGERAESPRLATPRRSSDITDDPRLLEGD